MKDTKQELARLKRYQHTIDMAKQDQPDTGIAMDIPTYQTEINKMKDEKKVFKTVLEDKEKNFGIQSERRAARNLFLELIAYRINDDKFNKTIDIEIVVEKCKEMIAKIEGNGTEDQVRYFDDGDEGLEHHLLKFEKDVDTRFDKEMVFVAKEED